MAAIQALMTRKRTLALLAACFLVALFFLVFVLGSTIVCDTHSFARAQILRTAAALDQYRIDVGKYPANLESLLEPGPEGVGPYISDRSLRDPWGRPLYYRVESDGRSFVLFTLGKDGRIGGEDADADFEVHHADPAVSKVR